ncbi:MAG: hypothetical protein AAF614_33220 [Chloroflexota bacterium]
MPSLLRDGISWRDLWLINGRFPHPSHTYTHIYIINLSNFITE